MKYLFSLLRRNVSVWQLLTFGVGGLIGAFIMTLSLQSYQDVNRAFSSDDALFADNYVVLSKPVSLRTTVQGLIGGQSPSFSDREIQEIENLPEVTQVAKFRTAQFTVDAMVKVGQRTLRTEMFLESVPDDFVDLPMGDVQWKASLKDHFVPVLVPRNYLDLYNFGYASSHGMPQLSEGLVGHFTFQLIIGGSFFHARIVGFSTRLNTILVPDDFLAEANRVYGTAENQQPSRIVARTKGTKPGNALLQHIAHLHYEVADGGDALVRMRSLVYGVIWTVVAVGLLVTLLSFFLLIVSFLLLIERTRDVIRNLASMGYNMVQITRPYRLIAVVVDVIVWVLAAVAGSLIYPLVGELILETSPGLEPSNLSVLFVTALVGCVCFILLHFIVIWFGVKKLLRKK